MEKALLTRKDVEHYVSLGKDTLYKMIREGRFPKPVRPSGTKVLWKKKDVDDWVEAQTPEAASK